MKYIYQARSKEGKIETGAVEASSKEAAGFLLHKYGIFVTSLKEEGNIVSRVNNMRLLSSVSKKDLAIFSRQLAVMLQSRVPVTQSLKSLASQIKNEGFKEKIFKIAQLVEEGNPLSDSFGQYPKIFNPFFVNLIKTGEASGKISESLLYLSEHLERENDIISQLKAAMIYPAFVIVVLCSVLLMVMFFVMPRLVDLLEQTSSKPPAITVFMIGFYGFLTNYGWILLLGALIFIGFIVYYLKTKEGKKNLDIISLRIPIAGSFLKKIFLIRFAENISTLISAGLSINKALEITKETVDNYAYKEMIFDVENRVSNGEKISYALLKYPSYAPAFVVQMIQVGEETGKLDKNLMEIVNFYQKEVNRTVATFTALLEPILIIFLGAVVALMALTVLQPLYSTLGTI